MKISWLQGSKGMVTMMSLLMGQQELFLPRI